ncbi:MAG: hypothetical protein JOY54_20020 [Acidobacteriaceae bacterium]|nr:hypothetical protein [Acidobacteriaceae bacterium]
MSREAPAVVWSRQEKMVGELEVDLKRAGLRDGSRVVASALLIDQNRIAALRPDPANP